MQIYCANCAASLQGPKERRGGGGECPSPLNEPLITDLDLHTASNSRHMMSQCLLVTELIHKRALAHTYIRVQITIKHNYKNNYLTSMNNNRLNLLYNGNVYIYMYNGTKL